jgi:hypothetical protein
MRAQRIAIGENYIQGGIIGNGYLNQQGCYWTGRINHECCPVTQQAFCNPGYYAAGIQVDEVEAFNEGHWLYCCKL